MAKLAGTFDTTSPRDALVIEGRANQRWLILYLCVNLALIVVTLAEFAAGHSGSLLLVGVLASVAAMQIAAVRRPPQISIENGYFNLRLPIGNPHTWPVQEVTDIAQDGDTLRLTFRTVEHIVPPTLRSSWEKQYARDGFHLELVGAFAPAQIERLRESLGMNPQAELQAGSMAEFQERLRASTPRVVVTPLLVAANLAMFAAVLATGTSLAQPAPDALVNWGANYGPLTCNGQSWRLLTAMFLHAGLLHLLLNMLVLCEIGPLLERLTGNFGYTILYFAGGLWGSIISVLTHPTAVAVGASGAIFALYGALGAFCLTRRAEIPLHFLRRYRGITIAFIAFNLVFGLFDRQIDLAAHLGGLVAGFVFGLSLFVRPARKEARVKPRPSRLLTVAALGIVSIVCGVGTLQGRIDNYAHEVGLFADVEGQVMGRVSELEVQVGENALSPDEFAAKLETEAIMPWSAALDRLAGLKDVPETHHDQWSQLVRYATLRKTAWQLVARGAREGNESLFKQATRMQSTADEIVDSLRDQARESSDGP